MCSMWVQFIIICHQFPFKRFSAHLELHCMSTILDLYQIQWVHPTYIELGSYKFTTMIRMHWFDLVYIPHAYIFGFKCCKLHAHWTYMICLVQCFKVFNQCVMSTIILSQHLGWDDVIIKMVQIYNLVIQHISCLIGVLLKWSHNNTPFFQHYILICLISSYQLDYHLWKMCG